MYVAEHMRPFEKYLFFFSWRRIEIKMIPEDVYLWFASACSALLTVVCYVYAKKRRSVSPHGSSEDVVLVV